MLTLTITGDREIDRKLSRLAPVIRDRVCREALPPAANLVAQAERDFAPKATGFGASTIRATQLKIEGNRASITVETNAGWFKGKAFYMAFQNFGWRVGKRRGAGIANRVRNFFRKRIPGKHFAERAYREKGPAAQELLTQLIAAGVERESKNL